MIFGHNIKYTYTIANSVRTLLLCRPSNNFSKCKSSTSNALEDPIVITNDGSTIVCWHPEKEFPYEFTKPLPVITNDKVSSVLKTSEKDAYKVFKKQSPESVREELMKMTYTTKHRWFPRSRDKKAKKTPKDRTYL
ncbi:hypothetical protein O3M35_011637 [Rhynocoris fuscipes]|uniref:Large ribosomal subunit protein mL42 n=1 Tax=Rhynocoris fuscipes TaxID=488301 RepID=A0AAW1CWZ4_9HEMI